MIPDPHEIGKAMLLELSKGPHADAANPANGVSHEKALSHLLTAGSHGGSHGGPAGSHGGGTTVGGSHRTASNTMKSMSSVLGGAGGGGGKAHSNPAKEYARFVREQARAARVLQRAYRIHLFHRAIRWGLRRHRHACSVSRVYRGHVARVYTVVFRRLRTAASIVVQSLVRMVKDRKRAQAYRKTVTNAALRIQPVWRGYKGRQYVKWVREVLWATLDIQRIIRGFLARCRFKRLLANKFHMSVIIPAVIKMQACYRGHGGRSIARGKKHAKWLKDVANPAVLGIQRCWRGLMGRREKEYRIALFYFAREIQRIHRGMKVRERFRQGLQNVAEYESVSTID